MGANLAAEDNIVAENFTMENGAEPAVVTISAQEFTNRAAANDAFEIAASKLALDKSKSTVVRAFAQQMIDAHTKSTAKLKAAAGSATPAITPDATIPPDMQKVLDALRAENSGFDALFIKEQIVAHDRALTMLEEYSVNGDVESVRLFAAETAPVVRSHLDMARGLQSPTPAGS